MSSINLRYSNKGMEVRKVKKTDYKLRTTLQELLSYEQVISIKDRNKDKKLKKLN